MTCLHRRSRPFGCCSGLPTAETKLFFRFSLTPGNLVGATRAGRQLRLVAGENTPGVSLLTPDSIGHVGVIRESILSFRCLSAGTRG